MGMTDAEIVALSGAHTIGRAYKERSGLPSLDKTKYTAEGPGTAGGMSWTPEWLRFDNSYFKVLKSAKDGAAGDPELLRLDTDVALFEDPVFAPTAERYAADEAAFFAEYAAAHAKLSELGSTFDPAEGIRIRESGLSRHHHHRHIRL